MNKQVTSMELLTLLHKSDYEHTKLTLAERSVLSVIICHINYKLEKGYEAWPSTDIIVAKTGLSTSGIGKCKKSLVEAKWVEIVSGRKAGVANHYFVNADKIVECARLSGVVHSGKALAETKPIPVQKDQHERNLVGFPNVKSKPKPVSKWIPEEDPDCPF